MNQQDGNWLKVGDFTDSSRSYYGSGKVIILPRNDTNARFGCRHGIGGMNDRCISLVLLQASDGS